MKWLLLSVVILVALWSDGALGRILVADNNQEDESEKGELWAVLVAGSSGWYNYRHQADVCHAYQILNQHGVPDDHIIVMMYDDISNNSANPNPGVIINRPEGPNVYEGILKDYTGEDVTPENFLNILKGNASAMDGIGSGKVVNSTHRDRVFVNLVDHGGPGLFGFPEDVLHATTLANTVLQLRRERKFKEMVIYVEACESGSLFKHLIPDDVKIYAISASNPHQPSYACYMDDDLETYLGDVFSIKWMEDTDKENIHHESLRHQFHLVRQEVTTSTVMQWGERDISKLKLWEFMGEEDDRVVNSISYQNHDPKITSSIQDLNIIQTGDEGDKNVRGNTSIPELAEDVHDQYTQMGDLDDPCISSAVASPDVPIAILKSRIARSKDDEQEQWRKELTALHLNRLLVHVITRSLVKQVTESEEMAVQIISGDAHNITRWECYDRSVDIFHDMCFNLGKNPYALRVMQMVVNLCELGYTSDKFLEVAQDVCAHPEFTGIH